MSAVEKQDYFSTPHRLLAVPALSYQRGVGPYQETPAGECGYRTFRGT